MLKTTPFHERTAPLVQGQAWRRWAGHAVASAYELVPDREYAAIRSAAALFDISPLHKYLIRGPDAGRLLDRVMTRAISGAAPGQVMYSTWCDPRGKVIDDGTVCRLEETLFRLTAGEPNLRWLHRNAFGLNAEIVDVSDQIGALALQGPLSRDILNRVVDRPISELAYFRAGSRRIAGVSVEISRTGYTGDLGYEIWVPADRALSVWDALIAEGAGFGITPAGIWALDTARIEAGLVMLDVDYHSAARALIDEQTSTPFELSLDWTVRFDKGPFNGRRALAAERARPAPWRLVGIEVDWDSLEALYAAAGLPPALPSVPWRASVPIYRDGRQVGYASSGCWSPLLKKYLALAHLQGSYAGPGSRVEVEITVEHHRRRADARVVALPFFDPPRKKALG